MKIWYNKIHESHRSVLDVDEPLVTLGRDAQCTLVLRSPLISRRHAVVRADGEMLELENVGLNSCLVGDAEVQEGERILFRPGVEVRLWPYTLHFTVESAPTASRQEIDAHLRSTLADLELRIHGKLLERLEAFGWDHQPRCSDESVLLLENNIEDICQQIQIFKETNRPLLDELCGMILRDLLVHQLVMESRDDDSGIDTTSNELDVLATLVPERETELRAMLRQLAALLELESSGAITSQVHLVEKHFCRCFAQLRNQLHDELRKYLVLRVLKKDLKDTVFGFGPLQDLLRAPSVSEIMVVASDQIYIERDGVIERSGRRFISDKVTESIIERIVSRVGRKIDKSQPLVDARLPDGSRVNAIIPPLAIRGPCLTVRKFPEQRITIDAMVESNSLTRAAAAFLRACVINQRNVLVSGGTGSGKTTLLNVLSSFIPFKQRIVTIEDTTELRLHQEHVVTLETKPANAEGAGAYTIRDLVINALRMRPDRILVGECRGGEAMDMIQAMNTGHGGSMTTIHANSAAEVIERLEVLMLMATEMPMTSLHRQIASALDVIVHIVRRADGRRLVTQICEVGEWDSEHDSVPIHNIFDFRNGQSLQPTGYLPTFIGQLIENKLLSLEFLYGTGPQEAAPNTRRLETRNGSGCVTTNLKQRKHNGTNGL